MEPPVTPHLNPAELYDRRRSVDTLRLKTYNMILEQIYNKVRTVSNLHTSTASFLFEIPLFIPGAPRFDMEDCVVYLMHQLRHAKYEVRHTRPNLLYVSWEHHERMYLMEQNPIMQTMLESYARTQAEIEQKEREAARLLPPPKRHAASAKRDPASARVSFANPYLASRTPSAPASASAPAFAAASSASSSAASASNYLPPTSFLQSLSHPSSASSASLGFSSGSSGFSSSSSAATSGTYLPPRK